MEFTRSTRNSLHFVTLLQHIPRCPGEEEESQEAESPLWAGIMYAAQGEDANAIA